jgi:hypothetical protein
MMCKYTECVSMQVQKMERAEVREKSDWLRSLVDGGEEVVGWVRGGVIQ